MASNVLELHRYDRSTDPRPLLDQVTIRDREGIFPAALCLSRAARAQGLRLMVWHDLATLAPMSDAQGQPLNTVAFGCEPEAIAPWQCREAAFRNPAFRACRIESEPFLIEGTDVQAQWPNPMIDSSAARDGAASGKRAAAIIVPVHLPLGQIGGAVLTSFDPAENLADVFANLPDTLAPAIRRFVRGYVTVTRDARYLPPQCLLSPREIECLSWVAQGKTDYEISIILGCSHAGVRYHLTRACERLGAVNRAQSVFRASQLGYIGPGAP